MSTFDIYLEPSFTERKPFGFGYAQAVKVTGATRVAQRFLKFLLTPRGSDPSGTVEGTNFSNLIGGNLTDTVAIGTEVQIAVDLAVQQIQRYASEMETPSLQSAAVVDVRFGAGRFDVYLRLLTTDGQVAQITLPLATPTANPRTSAMLPRYGDLLEGL